MIEVTNLSFGEPLVKKSIRPFPFPGRLKPPECSSIPAGSTLGTRTPGDISPTLPRLVVNRVSGLLSLRIESPFGFSPSVIEIRWILSPSGSACITATPPAEASPPHLHSETDFLKTHRGLPFHSSLPETSDSPRLTRPIEKGAEMANDEGFGYGLGLLA